MLLLATKLRSVNDSFKIRQEIERVVGICFICAGRRTMNQSMRKQAFFIFHLYCHPVLYTWYLVVIKIALLLCCTEATEEASIAAAA